MLQLLAGQDVVSGSRSKKSAAFRSKAQAAAEGEEAGGATASKPVTAEPIKIKVPASFSAALESLRRACVPLDVTGRNEARALLVSPSASPTFALLLSLEAAARESAKPGSLADVVLEGLISTEAGKPDSEGGGEGEASTESSDGVETLLRHPSGSHSLEAILSRLPSRYVDRFWSIYIRGKVSRLACHPVGNFVQASAVRRLGRPLVQEALEEIKVDEGGKMVKEAKTGVLLALLERGAVLSSDEDTALEALALDAVLATFGFRQNAKTDEAEAGLALKAILSLKSKDGWQKMMRRRAEKAAKQAASTAAAATEGQADQEDGLRKKRKRGEEEEEEEGKLRQEEATVQGSVLLQALVRLREPHNGIVYKG
jgi:nucleolar protein 9